MTRIADGLRWARHPVVTLLLGATLAVMLVGSLEREPMSGENMAGSLFEELVESGRFETLLRDSLNENPEIVVSALSRFQQQQAHIHQQRLQAAVHSHQDDLLDETIVPAVGNPRGDVTIVEFVDYQCGFCKRAHPMIQRLLADDGNVKLIYKEFPILGPASIYAARAVLAARKQDKFVAFHDALMEARVRLNESTIMRIAADVGLDVNQLEQDMATNVDAHQEVFVASHNLAGALGIEGTPSFVIGGNVVSGLIDEATLRRLIEDARQSSRHLAAAE